MRVGVPTEIKTHEYRVGLTPGAVREYVAHGHQVLVQSGAGAGIHADDVMHRAGVRPVPAVGRLSGRAAGSGPLGSAPRPPGRG